MFLHENLKKARTERNLSINDLCFELYAKAGIKVSTQAMYNWENGEAVPKLENALALSKVLGKPLDFFWKD